MDERITSLEISSSGGLSEPTSVKFQGFSMEPVDDEEMCGRITKVTGLEAPTMDVTGGPSSFGGSVYTGLKLNDRQVVVTVKPSDVTVKQIKNRLNALVNRSLRNPLTATFHTLLEDRKTSYLSGECYVTGVSSPIFDKDNSVQITLRLPAPHLERESMEWGVTEPVPISVLSDESYGGTRSVLYSISPPEMGSDILTADSPFNLGLQFTSTVGSRVRSIFLGDLELNAVNIILGSPYSDTNLNFPNMHITYQGKERRVGAMLYEVYKGDNITVKSGYQMLINRGWPVMGPGAEEIRMRIEYDEGYVGDALTSFTANSLTVYPRVLGV